MSNPNIDPVSSEIKTVFDDSEENVLRIARILRTDKSIKIHNPFEAIPDNKGSAILKRCYCMKSSNIQEWLYNPENQKKINVTIQNDKDIEVILKALIDNKYIRKAMRIKDETKRIVVACNDKEYIKHGILYIWDYEGPQTWKMIRSILTVIAMFAIPTYSLWPIWMKNIVFYGAILLSCAGIILELLRLVLFIIGWFFGLKFWIFPNLNDDSLGFWDSFKPFISCEKDEKGRVFYKLFALLLIVSIVSTVYLYPKEVNSYVKKTKRFAEKQMINAEYIVGKTKEVTLSFYHDSIEKIQTLIHPKKQPVHRSVPIYEDKVVEEREEGDNDNEEEEDYPIGDEEEINLEDLGDIELDYEL
ncbi:hypothetical protein WA158_007568 [Blastocystis sp. Blastoise]